MKRIKDVWNVRIVASEGFGLRILSVKLSRGVSSTVHVSHILRALKDHWKEPS